MPSKKLNKSGFTIVELLVVIVVIGILAAITIVTYSGITNKATVASLTSDLDNASKLLKLDQVTNMNYPANLAAANGGRGITASSGTTYQYVVNNNISPQSFCLAATKNSQTYKTTESFAPALGDCTNYLPVLYLDANNPASYPGSGTNWTDLSGSGNNGTLVGGAYKQNDYLVCDGTAGGNDDYIEIANSAASAYFNNPTNLTIMIVAQVNRESGVFGTDSNVFGHIIGKGVGDGYQANYNAYSIYYDARNNNMFNSLYRGTVPTQYPSDIPAYAFQNSWSDAQAANNWGEKFIAYYVISGDGNISYYWYRAGDTILTGTATYTTGGSFDNIYNLRICADYSGRYNKQRTWMVEFYDRALTAAEVQQNYNNFRGRFGI
jgi:prepilin-type N-terminal cleavage/methylation domain-containing protein